MLEVIPEPLDGERLDRVISMVSGISRSAAATAIGDGLVTLDGVEIRKVSLKVVTGQQLWLDDSVLAPLHEFVADAAVELDITHSDPDVLVVCKRPGQVVHPGAGHSLGTIAQGVVASYPEVRSVGEAARPGIVHRLDKGTSGVLVIARSDLAYRSLTGQLRERTVSRRYLTLGWGHPETSRGVIEAPIGRSVRDPTRMVVRGDGKAARTSYSAIATWNEPKVSLFSCVLDTGRTHQIRVHMEAIHHPVVGDSRYGAGRDRLGMQRPALHAADLGFVHPATGEWMEFSAPVPGDMDKVLNELGEPASGAVPT